MRHIVFKMLSAYQRQLSSLQKQQTYYKTITNIQQYSTKFSTFQQNFKNVLGYDDDDNVARDVARLSYVNVLQLMNK